LVKIIDQAKNKLLRALADVRNIDNWIEKASTYRQKVFNAMEEVRKYCDELERIVPKKLWPFPTYADILFD
jgi:glutamine synthetase